MLDKLISIDVNPMIDFFPKKEIKTLNFLALVIVLGVLIGTTNYFFHRLVYPLLAQMELAFLTFFIFVVNHKQKYYSGKGFNDIKKRSNSSLEITLLESLVDQINGTIFFRNENGACVNLIIPI